MKYIMISVIHRSLPERLVPIIFPDAMVHEQVFEAIFPLLAIRGTKIAIKSAGEIDMMVQSTHGKSVSLGVEAQSEDANVINAYYHLHGILT